MAKFEIEHLFKGDIEKVFYGISQYDKYIQYLQEVKKIQVLPPQEEDAHCTVEYHIKIIKDFFYSLNMYHDQPKSITWTLAESNIFKKNNGGWHFKAKGKTQTIATYSLDVAFKLFVPDSLIEKVTKANLPTMLEGMQRLIDDCSEKKKT